MSLINVVARLKEMERKAIAKGIPRYTVPYIELACDNGPTMLAALSLVRAGDTDEIAYAIDVVAQYQNDDATIDTLRRYLELARLMEGESK